jgi:proteasome lid subunit RPN8/RPN11
VESEPPGVAGGLEASISYYSKMLRRKNQQALVMRQYAEHDYPYECCRLLMGRFLEDGHKEVLEIYPISKAREEEHKRNRF